MKFKQFIVKLLKIDVSPVYTISIADYENSEIAPRASGRTTRLADMYIQLLFSTGGIKVQDHHQDRQSDMVSDENNRASSPNRASSYSFRGAR